MGVHGEEDVQARAFAHGHHAGGDFVDGVTFHFLSAIGTVSPPDASEEQTQVVINLSGGGYGRARIPRGILLLNGDSRGDAFDGIDVRLLDTLEELAGVGRKRLDIPALAFGIDGVKGEGRLAGPRDPGHNRESVVRHLNIDVLKVMDARAAHDDAVNGHGWAVTGHTDASGMVSESFYYKSE